MGKSYKHFTDEERSELARLQAQGCSKRQIAAALDRAPSSVSRELRRNQGAKSYNPIQAKQRARSRRWTGSKLERDGALRTRVLGHLACGLSPEQITGRLLLEGSPFRISHETIYRFIYAQIARHKDYSWRHYLPHAKFKRGLRKGRTGGAGFTIKNRVSIAQRPRFIEARKQVGHWEADLLLFSNKKSNVLVTQERASRFIHLARQSDRTAGRVAENLSTWFKTMPPALRRSLTQDNGVEFAHHHKLGEALALKTYFCDRHSPWQKGGIENMNGRLRRYLPLDIDFKNLSPHTLQAIQDRINNTPRKCLGFKTPAELFTKHVLHFKCESTFPPARE